MSFGTIQPKCNHGRSVWTYDLDTQSMLLYLILQQCTVWRSQWSSHPVGRLSHPCQGWWRHLRWCGHPSSAPCKPPVRTDSDQSLQSSSSHLTCVLHDQKIYMFLISTSNCEVTETYQLVPVLKETMNLSQHWLQDTLKRVQTRQNMPVLLLASCLHVQDFILKTNKHVKALTVLYCKSKEQTPGFNMVWLRHETVWEEIYVQTEMQNLCVHVDDHKHTQVCIYMSCIETFWIDARNIYYILYYNIYSWVNIACCYSQKSCRAPD